MTNVRVIKNIIEGISASNRVDKIFWTQLFREYLDNLGENSRILKMLEGGKRKLKFIRPEFGKG